MQAIPKQLANRQFSSIKTLTTKINAGLGKTAAKTRQRQSNMWKYIDELVQKTLTSGSFIMDTEEEEELMKKVLYESPRRDEDSRFSM